MTSGGHTFQPSACTFRGRSGSTRLVPGFQTLEKECSDPRSVQVVYYELSRYCRAGLFHNMKLIAELPPSPFPL